MRIAKADEEDLETTRDFLQACEQLWSRRPYQMGDPAEEWEEWDDDDQDKIQLLTIRKRLAKELRYSEDDVDHRLIIYEFLKSKYKKCDCNWGRVYYAAAALIPHFCDPQKSYLDASPYLEELHVAPEH